MTIQETSQERIKLSREYFDYMKELAGIEQKKAFEIMKMRETKECKSYADAERKWETTDLGQREIYLNRYSKGLEKIISSLNTDIRLGMANYYDNSADSSY